MFGPKSRERITEPGRCSVLLEEVENAGEVRFVHGILDGDVRKASGVKKVFELTRLTERGRADEEGAACIVAGMAQQRTTDRAEDGLLIDGSPNAGGESAASDEDSANLGQCPLAIVKELQALLASDCVE